MIRYKQGNDNIVKFVIPYENFRWEKIFFGISILFKISFYIVINLINNI